MITLVAENELSYLKKMTKKLALPLTEIYLYKGNLVTERPLSATNEKNTQNLPKEKHKDIEKVHTSVSTEKKKKKKRHSKQKNIGKRRV